MHLLADSPKNVHCIACRQAKVTNVRFTRGDHEFIQFAREFGDRVTADTIVLSASSASSGASSFLETRSIAHHESIIHFLRLAMAPNVMADAASNVLRSAASLQDIVYPRVLHSFVTASITFSRESSSSDTSQSHVRQYRVP